MKSLRVLSLAILFCTFYLHVFSVKYGSDLVVSVQPLVTFPSADGNNEMVSFGWFKNGFELEDYTTSCTFSSIFPVSGSIALRGGSLFLNSDMHLANITTLAAMGRICGQNHIVTIDSSVGRLINTHYPTTLKDVDLFINSDLEVSTTVRIEGSCHINGQNKRLYMDTGSHVEVGHNSTLYLRNLELEGIGDYNIRCIDDTGKILLDNVSIYMDEDYNFTTGQLEVWNNVDFSGSHTFFYDCLKTFTVAVDSVIKFCDGSTFAVGAKRMLSRDRIIYFEDQSAKIWVDNSNMIIGPAGGHVTRGSMVLSGRVSFDIQSTNTGNGLILGDGTPEGDTVAEFYPASYITFNNGHVVYNESDPNKFVSKSTYSKLIRGAANTFHIVKDQIFNNVTITVDPNSVLSVEPGAKLEYDGCRIVMPTVKFSITGIRYNTYTTLLGGDDEIFMEDGILPFYLLIQNSNNYISGNGNLSGVTTLYNSNASVMFNMDGQVLNYVVLNGGTANLTKNLAFAQDKCFVGAGKVNLSGNDLTLGSKDMCLTSTIYWDGVGGKINLNSKVAITGTWTFSGNCTIVGNNNQLVFKPSARIYVERGSTLNFKNVIIYGLEGTNLSCVDDTSKMVFNGSLCKLIDDYYFDKGAFDVSYSMDVEASDKTFYYRSTKQSVVLNCSVLAFHATTGFDYCPNSADKNLINLQTRDSIIWLKEASLNSTATGMQLTTGRLFVEGKCQISSDATCAAEAITFGDGISAANDLNVKILPGGTFDLTSGYVVSKNIVN